MKRTLCASGLFERRYGRDALNNTFCECVVAKANEADCFANAEVQTREKGGEFQFNWVVIDTVKNKTIKRAKRVNQANDIAKLRRAYLSVLELIAKYRLREGM